MVRSSNAADVERNVGSTGGNQHSYTLCNTKSKNLHPINLPIGRLIRKYCSDHFRPAESVTECSRMVDGRAVYC